MSNYCVSIGERQYQIKVLGSRLLVDNEPVQVDLIPLNGSGLHLLHRGRQALEVHLQPQEAGAYEVLVGGRRVIARVESGQRKNLRRKEGGKAGELAAPMPGLVVDVLVRPGDEVERGQVLAVLESMKMQMQMRSPVSGRVKVVAVEPGGQVEKGGLLVRVAEGRSA